jgi:thiol-disulfide isomerase/thioredoxin
MVVATASILIVLVISAALAVAGIAWQARLRPMSAPSANAQRVLAWLLILGGFGVVGGVAGLQLIGRLGQAQLWFRAPSFYLAAAILLAGAWWWLRRPIDGRHARLIRFGLPAGAMVLLGAVALILRLDGHSTPLSALMPTLRTPAPALSYFDADGNTRQLAELRGKVVLINFWATWCAPCRKEMPMLSAAQSEFGKDGLVVIYLSLEEPAVLEPFLRAHHFEGVKGRLASAADYYRAGQIYPLSYLISRDGRVAKRWSGRPLESWLQEAIRAEL